MCDVIYAPYTVHLYLPLLFYSKFIFRSMYYLIPCWLCHEASVWLHCFLLFWRYFRSDHFRLLYFRFLHFERNLSVSGLEKIVKKCFHSFFTGFKSKIIRQIWFKLYPLLAPWPKMNLKQTMFNFSKRKNNVQQDYFCHIAAVSIFSGMGTMYWSDWFWGRRNRFQGIRNIGLSRWWWMDILGK